MSAFKKALLLGVMWMTASLSAYGSFYKWVDQNGVTQYTQTPPPAGNYQELHSLPPASGSNSEQQQTESAPAKQDAAGAAEEAPPPDDQDHAAHEAARRQNCQLARERLSQLENHARIRYTAADGSVRVMGEAEKQAKLTETRKMIREMCR
jgi:hypothetical protein